MVALAGTQTRTHFNPVGLHTKKTTKNDYLGSFDPRNKHHKKYVTSPYTFRPNPRDTIGVEYYILFSHHHAIVIPCDAMSTRYIPLVQSAEYT